MYYVGEHQLGPIDSKRASVHLSAMNGMRMVLEWASTAPTCRTHCRGRNDLVTSAARSGLPGCLSLCPCVCVHAGFAETSSEGAALGCIGLAASEGLDYTKWTRMGGV